MEVGVKIRVISLMCVTGADAAECLHFVYGVGAFERFCLLPLNNHDHQVDYFVSMLHAFMFVFP